MKMELPDRPTSENTGDPLRLRDVQAVALESGVLLKRGLTRVHLEADDLAPVLETLIESTRTQGGATRADLIAAVAPEEGETMAALVDALIARRLLAPVDAGSPDPSMPNGGHEDVFYWNYDRRAADVRRALAAKRLAVIGVNHVGTALVGALAGLGFASLTHVDHPLFRNMALPDPVEAIGVDAWQDAADLPDCIILTSDFGGPDLARDWNRFCVDQDILFYAVLLQDQVGLVGPMVVPGTTACHECLAAREAAASPSSAMNRATDATAFFAQNSVGFIAPMTQAAASIAATELLKFFSQALPGGPVGRLVEVDLLEPSIAVRRVLKVPRCPVCGPVRAAPTPTPEIGLFMPGNE